MNNIHGTPNLGHGGSEWDKIVRREERKLAWQLIAVAVSAAVAMLLSLWLTA